VRPASSGGRRLLHAVVLPDDVLYSPSPAEAGRGPGRPASLAMLFRPAWHDGPPARHEAQGGMAPRHAGPNHAGPGWPVAHIYKWSSLNIFYEKKEPSESERERK